MGFCFVKTLFYGVFPVVICLLPWKQMPFFASFNMPCRRLSLSVTLVKHRLRWNNPLFKINLLVDSLDLGDIVRDCPSARCTTRLSCLYHEAVVAGDCWYCVSMALEHLPSCCGSWIIELESRICGWSVRSLLHLFDVFLLPFLTEVFLLFMTLAGFSNWISVQV